MNHTLTVKLTVRAYGPDEYQAAGFFLGGEGQLAGGLIQSITRDEKENTGTILFDFEIAGGSNAHAFAQNISQQERILSVEVLTVYPGACNG